MSVPAGLLYHLSDIYLEELDKASGDLNPAPLSIILKPFLLLASQTPTKTVYDRIESAVIHPLVAALRLPLSTQSDEEPPSSKRQKLQSAEYTDLLSNACSTNPAGGVLQRHELRRAFLRQIFDIASKQETRDANRRKLYALWKANSEDEEEVENERV